MHIFTANKSKTQTIGYFSPNKIVIFVDIADEIFQFRDVFVNF